jgi:hypothetical protein
MNLVKLINYNQKVDYIRNKDLFTFRISFTFYFLLIFFTILTTILFLVNLDLLINGSYLLELENNMDFYSVKVSNLNSLNTNLNHKSPLFSTFIDLFDKNNSSNKYFPSCFLKGSSNLSISVEYKSNIIIDETAFMEIMSYKKKYFIAEYENSGFRCLITDINKIIKDYNKSLPILLND